MSHRNKKWFRLLQKHTMNLAEQIRFKTSHISYGWKLCLLWCLLSFFSLFQSWIYTQDMIIGGSSISITSASSFSPLVWYIWVLLSSILGTIIFSIVSLRKKEKLHFLGLLRIHESTIAFIWGISIIVLSFQSFLFINGLRIFSADILYGKGIIFCIIGGIFILLGSYYLKKDYRKNSKWSYISELKSGDFSKNLQEEKDNMKLPF